MRAVESNPVPTQSQPQRYHRTLDRMLIAVLAIEGFLLLSEWLGWLGLGATKGWPVMAAVATVVLVPAVLLLRFAFSADFRSHFQYPLRSLLLLVVAVAISCGWLSTQMQESKQQEAAVRAVLNAGGGVEYQGGKKRGSEALRGHVGDELFSDIKSVQTAPSLDPSIDPFGAAARKMAESASPENVNDNTLLQITKGLSDLKNLNLSKAQIGDDALAHLKAFDQLERLWLNETQLTDAGLVHIGGVTTIQSLNLRPQYRKASDSDLVSDDG